MITIEHEAEYTRVVALSNAPGHCEDVEVLFEHDGIVYMRQYHIDPKTRQEKIDIIQMTYPMYVSLFQSLSLDEGVYKTDYSLTVGEEDDQRL